MEHTALIAYFVALTAYAASPGPLVAVLVARSVGSDMRGAAAFATGLCLGEMLAVGAIAIGLGSLATSYPEWFAAAKYAGIAYLLWLATRIWRDSCAIKPVEAGAGRFFASVGAGLAVCLGNPATFIVNLMLLPIVAPAGITGGHDLTIILLVTFAAFGIVFYGVVLMAGQIGKLIATPRSARLFGRSAATAIGATGMWMLAA